MAVELDRTVRQISGAVREHRKLSGLSRQELADLAGIGKTALYDIEHEKATVRLATLLKVLRALNLRLRIESPLPNWCEGRQTSSSV